MDPILHLAQSQADDAAALPLYTRTDIIFALPAR